MNTKNQISIVSVWTARILGSAILAFALFMIFAHIFGDEVSSNQPLSSSEIASSVFGILMLIGLTLAIFKEGLGGMIIMLGTIGFFIVNPDNLSDPGYFGLVAVPGLLYLLYWHLNRKKTREK